MSGRELPRFEGGENIAMKLPPHVFDRTIGFYKDVLRLPLIEENQESVVFRFGSNRLWLDRVDGLSQSEIWLEVVTDDLDAAAGHLETKGTVRRDEIEALPEGFQGFWIGNPADIIHLVTLK